MKLAVVIVSYNVKHFLHQCLHAVERAMQGIDAAVYVVDNNSSDGSVEFLRPLHPGVHFISNKDNVGFARANNAAIRLSRSDYVLLLNPDTIVSEQTLERCISFMDTHPEAGGVGVKMLNADGTFAPESRRGVPTPFTAFCKFTGLCALFPKSRVVGRYYMRYLDAERVAPIEIISGACMFLRRSTLDRCGLLDEDFFMYGEDIDLSYRILQAGQKNYYLPVPILHYKGESTHRASLRYVNAFHKAMLIFFRKHYGHSSLLLSLPVGAMIYARAALTFAVGQARRLLHNSRAEALKMARIRFAFVGTDDDFEAVRSLLARQNWRVQRGELNADFIVYNAEAMDYADILRRMEVRGRNGRRPKLATYHPTLGTVIIP